MKCRDDQIKVAMKTDIGVCMMIITALCVLQIGSISFAETTVYNADSTLLFNRSSFPPGFIFGLASSAYQSEGAAFKDGKGASIWDTFTHQFPEKIADRSNGDVANNFYYLYKEDVKLLKFIGVDTFRMSISWSRILPRGKLSGGVNKEGISFYNNVFNELLANGIFPFVTIFHGDLPQALEDEYGGFLSPLIIDDFRDFAELCFKEFGDRVKYWITLNEPYYLSIDVGDFAPNRCSNSSTCSQGNSETDPYIAAHYLLLSHASTVELYKKKYQGIQRGKIGITLNSDWFVPSTNSKLDVKAAQRALDFMYGWFVDPVVYGNYPRIMQSLVGNRLPNFTKKESAMLKGSFDFLGLNYYTARYASNILKNRGNITSSTDSMVDLSFTRNGVPIGEATGSSNVYVYPKGLHDLLVYVKEKYNNPTIYITENGIPDSSNSTLSQNIKDQQRINFYNRHLQAVRRAIREGVNVKSFIAWTFTDDFEWQFGYSIRFGFFYVDYMNGLKRIPKQSVFWFKSFLNK